MSKRDISRLLFLFAESKMGRTMLFFGCQNKSMDLYKTDKMEMINEGVLNKTYLALSREPSIPKVWFRFYLI